MAKKIVVFLLISLLMLTSCGINNEDVPQNSTAPDRNDSPVDEVTTENPFADESVEPDSGENEEGYGKEPSTEGGIRLPKDEF